MQKPKDMTRGPLLIAIQQAWAGLHSFLNSLTESQMTGIPDAGFWSVKDHLTHLAIWELSIVYFLQGRPRHEALGTSLADYQGLSTDEINAAIQAKHRGLPLGEVMKLLSDTHAQVLPLIEAVSEEELRQPVREFHPESRTPDRRLVYDIIFDNTAGHFAEHLGWMRAMV